MHQRRFFSGFALLCLAAVLSARQSLAQSSSEESPVQPSPQPGAFLVRLNALGGQAEQNGRMGDTEFGADLLLSANEFQRYGIHVSSLTLHSSPLRQRYICTGYVLEMVLFHWLRAEIGTVGFIGRGQASGQNPFGVLYTLGYEKRVGRMNYSIAYDSKTVFTKPAITINNLGVSVGLHF